jgi:DNA polymerase I
LKHEYYQIESIEEVRDLMAFLDECESWSFDTEGTSLDIFRNKIIGIGFSWLPGYGVYLPLRVYKPILGIVPYWIDKSKGWNYQEEVLLLLGKALSNKSKKYAHNSKYDVQVLFLDLNMCVSGLEADTMLLLSLVQPGREKYGLDAISKDYPDLSGYKQKVAGKELFRLPMQELVEYNCADCDLTFRIAQDNLPALYEDTKMSYLFTNMVMPLVNMITRMEIGGIRVDVEAAKKLHKELFDELIIIANEITSSLGTRVNLRSTDQLGHILFDLLKLPVLKKTKGGKPATGKQVLSDLNKKTGNPVLKKIIRYRSLAASKTGFVDGFVPVLARKDNKDKEYLLDKLGYIHGNYKLISKTGRLRSGKDADNTESTNSRNLQNTSRDPRFRRLFLADPNHVFIGADYAQLELRVLAHVCADNELLRAFSLDYDPHCLVGGFMAGVPYEEVLEGYKRKDPKYIAIRDLSKNIGFGWVYMAGDGRFAFLFPGRNEKEQFAAEVEAKARYFSRFSRIIPWRNSMLDFARQNGFVRTVSGRKILTPDINSSESRVRAHAEKQCVNSLIQGPASDLTCLSAVQLDAWINEKDYDARVVNLIHDAIYSSANIEIAEEVHDKMKEIMEIPKFGITTKMKADIHMWDRWQGEEIKKKTIEEFVPSVEVVDETDGIEEDEDEEE